MPELPEVETLRRGLAKTIVGKVIQKVEVKNVKTITPATPVDFEKIVKGKKIEKVERRAKVLVVHLSAGRFLFVHLKMTGQLIYQPKNGKAVYGGHPQPGGLDNLPNAFTQVIISFTDGTTLFFNDMRKFGWMRLGTLAEYEIIDGNLGPEPLGKKFSLAYFCDIIRKYPKRKVKQILLDQTLIAGIGNIYADESCFYAEVLPYRVAGTLKPGEVKKLHEGIGEILKLGIAKKGTSVDTYVQLDGKAGRMVKYLKVYNKKGQRCSRCGEVISKMILNGRGTHYCLGCQQ